MFSYLWFYMVVIYDEVVSYLGCWFVEFGGNVVVGSECYYVVGSVGCWVWCVGKFGG